MRPHAMGSIGQSDPEGNDHSGLTGAPNEGETENLRADQRQP